MASFSATRTSTGRPRSTSQVPVNGYDLKDDSDRSDTVEPVLVLASVKIMCPDGKRADHQTFMMHNVNVEDIKSIVLFRKELHAQFGSKFIDNSNEFDFG